MNVAGAASRGRFFIYLLLYLLGFLPPWQYPLPIGRNTLWLAAATELARTGMFTLAGATLGVTLAALGCLLTGSALRVSGIATGRSRMPATGSWLLALGSSILMPLTGALFFLPAFTTFTLFLLRRQQKPPAMQAGHTRWLPALLAEIYPVTFTVCFASLAWRYNAYVLIKALLVSCGLALVMRALFRQAPAAR